MHGGGRSDDGDDETNVSWYCSTHGNYYHKPPILIEVNWAEAGRRARKDRRYWGGGVTP